MTDLVTIRGNVGKAPTSNTLPSGTPVANFSVATTPRWYDYNQGIWREGTTSWYQVKTYRNLAENCSRCLYQGQPVIVTGRLNIREWTDKEGRPRASAEIDATAVGHDLNMGTSSYIKPERRVEQPDAQGRNQHSPIAASAPNFSIQKSVGQQAPPMSAPSTDSEKVDTDTGEIQKIEDHANSGAAEDFSGSDSPENQPVYTSESEGIKAEENAPF